MRQTAFVAALPFLMTLMASPSVQVMLHAQPNAVAAAPAKVDPDLFEQGQQSYAMKCAGCHQAGGLGMPPNLKVCRGWKSAPKVMAL